MTTRREFLASAVALTTLGHIAQAKPFVVVKDLVLDDKMAKFLRQIRPFPYLAHVSIDFMDKVGKSLQDIMVDPNGLSVSCSFECDSYQGILLEVLKKHPDAVRIQLSLNGGMTTDCVWYKRSDGSWIENKYYQDEPYNWRDANF